jgi:hypothetical protein
MKLDRGMTRREMLKGALLAIPGFVALMAASKNALAAMVDEKKDATAKALKYVSDGASTAKGRPDKMGIKGAEQNCSNCQFYTKIDDKKGKCLMITSGEVAAKGWCASWTKKA